MGSALINLKISEINQVALPLYSFTVATVALLGNCGLFCLS